MKGVCQYILHKTSKFLFSEDEGQTKSKQQDSDKLNSLTIPSVSKRVVLGDSVSTGTTDQQSGVAEVKGTQLGDKLDSFIKPPECSNDVNLELRQRNRGDLTADTIQRGSRHGLEQYLSRFEEAMKLRKQLISEKPNQEDGNTTEEFDSFRIFRLVGCALLALGVRAFVCKYLVSSRVETANWLWNESFYSMELISSITINQIHMALWRYKLLFTLDIDEMFW